MATILNNFTKVFLVLAVAILTVPSLGAAASPALGSNTYASHGAVVGEWAPLGLDGTISCSNGVGIFFPTAAEGTLQCDAGSTTVVCCTYQLVLGISSGFVGSAQVKAQFSGGATHTFKCTWTAPAGTITPACTSTITGTVFVGETAAVTGKATGSSASGSWSFSASFQNP